MAELAAEGLSNKEIARTLFVTVHTVEKHLSKAYAKLGIRSRGELGAQPLRLAATGPYPQTFRVSAISGEAAEPYRGAT